MATQAQNSINVLKSRIMGIIQKSVADELERQAAAAKARVKTFEAEQNAAEELNEEGEKFKESLDPLGSIIPNEGENDEDDAPDASDSSEVPDEAPEVGDEKPADHDEDEAPEDDEIPDEKEQTGDDAPEAGDETPEDNEEHTGSGAPETPKKRTTRAKRAKKA